MSMLIGVLFPCEALRADTRRRMPRGHYMLTPPSRAAPLIVVAGTPSDFRVLAKIRSQLRRAGVHPDKRTS